MEPHRRVVIATETPDAVRDLARLVDREGLVPEIWSRAEALEVGYPVRATVLCAQDPDGWESVLRAWARAALQPLSVVIMCSSPGATEFDDLARELGFDRILHRPTTHRPIDRHFRPVREETTPMLRQDFSLVPLVSRHAGGLTPAAAHLCAAAFTDPPPLTVPSWVRAVPASFREQALADIQPVMVGTPKRVLSNLRVLHAVYLSCGTVLTRDDIARRVGYANGKYLGQLAKEAVGRPFRSIDTNEAAASIFSKA